MRKQHFEELLKIHSEHEGEKPSYPFKPHIGSEFKAGKGQPRLMFVGKATYDWQKGDNASKFIKEEIKTRKYASPFWRHIFDIASAVYNETDVKKLDIDNLADREWVIDRIVWSNLAKIGSKEKGNPSGVLLKDQKEICEKILREEIDELSPTGIVLVSGYFMENTVKEIFGKDVGKDGWNTDHENWFWYKTWENSIGVYWSRHPQGWPNDKSKHGVGRQTVIKKIAEHQSKILNSAR